MEGDEGAATILLRKLAPRVELQVVGCPVGREADEGVLGLGAPAHRGPVTAILRCQDFDVRGRVVVAVGPSEIVTLFDEDELLRRLLCALFVGEVFAKEGRKLVTAMDDAVEPTGRMGPKGHRVPKPGGEPNAVLLALADPMSVEAPDPGPGVQLWARVQTR